MNGFVARALWVRSLVAQTKGIRGELDEAIVLARMSGERPLLWALLALADSGEAQQVFEEMGQTIRDQRLRESFRATVSSGFTVGREPATGAQSQEEVPHDMDAI